MIFFFVISALALEAQELVYHAESVEVSITGTSTLHDWTVKASEVTDYPEAVSLSVTGGEIRDFAFKVAVVSMDGGRGASMNDKIKKALDAKNHPFITFVQTAASTVDMEVKDFQTEGDISIAGKTKPYIIKVAFEQDEDVIKLSGQQAISLSDFDIEPPSAMFGQIQTGEEVIVHFVFTYKKS